MLSLIAGPLGGAGWADDVGAAARFKGPAGVASDGADTLFVADNSNCTIRKVTISSRKVRTLAGDSHRCGSTDGTGTNALFFYPNGVTFDGQRHLFVVDTYNNTIRKVDTSSGVVTTLAGKAGEPAGSADGTGDTARFNMPSGAALDGTGNLFIADAENHTIRKLDLASGVVSTIAGTAGQSGDVDGTGPTARFFRPTAVTFDGMGNLFIADFVNSAVRKLELASGAVTTVPGTDVFGDDAIHPHQPTDVVSDGKGTLFVADGFNHLVRKIVLEPNVIISTFVGAAVANSESVDGTGASARFNFPEGLALDGKGHLFVTDESDNEIREVVIDSGKVTTLAGAGGPEGSQDGVETAARFSGPSGVASDGKGNLFVADTYNCEIRKVVLASGAVTTFVGSARMAGSTDGAGPGALFDDPTGVALDGQGNLFVADQRNGTIRQVVVDTGVVTTFAGKAGETSASIDGSGDVARFRLPYSLVFDGQGDLFVTDSHAIRQIVLATKEVTTLAGSADQPGSQDGTGDAARFNFPFGLASDSNGTIYVADLGNHTIRKVVVSKKEVTTLAGSAGQPDSTDGAGTAARFHYPSGVAYDGHGNLYVADTNNHAIRRIVVASAEVSTYAGNPAIGRIRPGRLPGELSFPTAVVVTPSGLVISDGNSILSIDGEIAAR